MTDPSARTGGHGTVLGAAVTAATVVAPMLWFGVALSHATFAPRTQPLAGWIATLVALLAGVWIGDTTYGLPLDLREQRRTMSMVRRVTAVFLLGIAARLLSPSLPTAVREVGAEPLSLVNTTTFTVAALAWLGLLVGRLVGSLSRRQVTAQTTHARELQRDADTGLLLLYTAAVMVSILASGIASRMSAAQLPGTAGPVVVHVASGVCAIGGAAAIAWWRRTVVTRRVSGPSTRVVDYAGHWRSLVATGLAVVVVVAVAVTASVPRQWVLAVGDMVGRIGLPTPERDRVIRPPDDPFEIEEVTGAEPEETSTDDARVGLLTGLTVGALVLLTALSGLRTLRARLRRAAAGSDVGVADRSTSERLDEEPEGGGRWLGGLGARLADLFPRSTTRPREPRAAILHDYTRAQRLLRDAARRRHETALEHATRVRTGAERDPPPEQTTTPPTVVGRDPPPGHTASGVSRSTLDELADLAGRARHAPTAPTADDARRSRELVAALERELGRR